MLLITTFGLVCVCTLLYQTVPGIHISVRLKSCQKAANERSSTSETVSSGQGISGGNFNVCSETVDNPYNYSEGWKKFTSVLDQYKHFHKQELQLLRRDDLDVRTLTFSCQEDFCSGMGDQFNRLEFVLLLAVISKRVFRIEWDEGLTRKNRYLLPNMINWKLSANESSRTCGKQGKQCTVTFGRTSVVWQSWKKKDWANFERVLFGTKPNVVVSGEVSINIYLWFATDTFTIQQGSLIQREFDRIGLSDILAEGEENRVLLYTPNLWKNLFQAFHLNHLLEIPDKHHVEISKSWIYLSHHILHYLFKFHPVLIAHINHIQKSLGLYNSKYLAIHLRTGYAGSPSQEKAITRWMSKNAKIYMDEKSWKVVLNHSMTLAAEKPGLSPLVYLATDSNKALELALSMYGDRIRTSNQTIQPHSSVSTPKSGSYCVDSDDRHLSFWVDFFMLGRAYVMVHGCSSFAMSAGWLCPVPLDRHSWVLYSDKKHCMASHVVNNVTCLSSQV